MARGFAGGGLALGYGEATRPTWIGSRGSAATAREGRRDGSRAHLLGVEPVHVFEGGHGRSRSARIRVSCAPCAMGDLRGPGRVRRRGGTLGGGFRSRGRREGRVAVSAPRGGTVRVRRACVNEVVSSPARVARDAQTPSLLCPRPPPPRRSRSGSHAVPPASKPQDHGGLFIRRARRNGTTPRRPYENYK